MSLNGKSIIPEILKNYQAGLLTGWMKEQAAGGLRRENFMKETELRQQSTEFLSLLTDATQSGNLTNIQASEWSKLREILTSISNSRARQGFSHGNAGGWKPRIFKSGMKSDTGNFSCLILHFL